MTKISKSFENKLLEIQETHMNKREQLIQNIISAEFNNKHLLKNRSQFTKEDLEGMLSYCSTRDLTAVQLMKLVPRMLPMFASLELFDEVNATVFTQIDPTKVGAVAQLGARKSAFLNSVPLVYPLFKVMDFDEFYGPLKDFLRRTTEVIVNRIKAEKSPEASLSFVIFMLKQMVNLMVWKEKQMKSIGQKIEEKRYDKKRKRSKSDADSKTKSSSKNIRREVDHVTNPLKELHEIVLTTFNFIFQDKPFEAFNLKLTGRFEVELPQVNRVFQNTYADLLIEVEDSEHTFFLYECIESLKSLENFTTVSNEKERFQSVCSSNNNETYLYSSKNQDLNSKSLPKLYHVLSLFKQIVAYFKKFGIFYGCITDVSNVINLKFDLAILQKIDLQDPFEKFDELLSILQENKELSYFINRETERINKLDCNEERIIDAQDFETISLSVAELINFTNRKEPVLPNTVDYNEDTAFPLKVNLVKWFVENEVKKQLKDVNGYTSRNPGCLLDSVDDLRSFFDEKICFIPMTVYFDQFKFDSEIPLQTYILSNIAMVLSDNGFAAKFIHDESFQAEFSTALGSLLRISRTNIEDL